MNKSEKIKRELSNFWLKQLDQSKDNAHHGGKDQLSQQSSTLAFDPFFQRQIRRITSGTKGKRELHGSAVQPSRIACAEKQPGSRPVITLKVVAPNHHPSAADQLRQWFSQNVDGEQFEGQFYVKPVDLLSLQQATQDWNISAGGEYEVPRSRYDWLTIDDRFVWLSPPTS